MSQKRKLRSASLLMIVATGIANLSMVVFHRIMSSGLGDGYGRLMALFAISNVLSALTMGANTFLVKEFSRDAELKGPGAIKGRLLKLMKPLALTLFFSGALLLGIGPWVTSYLKLPSLAEYALVVALFLGGLLLLVARAAVQGMHHFQSLGLSISLESLSRVALGYLAVGYGVAGSLLGMLGSQGLGLAGALGGLNGMGKTLAPPPHAKNRETWQVRLREISGDTLALGLFSAVCFMDLFVVKHYYQDAAASSYSRAALVAKSFLYLTSALTLVLLPAVAAAREGGRDPRGLLLRFSGAALAINLAGLAFIWRFTDWVIALVCGNDPAFLALSPLVRVFSVATILLSLFQLLVYYLLAQRSKAALLILAVAVPAYYCLLEAFHETGASVVMSLGTVAALGLAAAFVAAWKIPFASRRAR